MSIAIQPNRQLDSILARLESLQSLVKDELQIYQRLPSIGTELAEKVVSIVIPVYNEQASVARVISRRAQ